MENQTNPPERSGVERASISKVTFTFKDGTTQEYSSYKEAIDAAREDNENK